MTPFKILTALFLVKLAEKSFALAEWATHISKKLIADQSNEQREVSRIRRELPERR